jgi:hypothetical protein
LGIVLAAALAWSLRRDDGPLAQTLHVLACYSSADGLCSSLACLLQLYGTTLIRRC